MNEEDSKFVYWEKQGKDRMWGLHCLNSLVQGPLFDESSLWSIAHELDQLEKAIYEGEPTTPQATSKDGTNNIEADGNYNVQVIVKALQNLGDFEIESLEKKGVHEANQTYSDEQGFIWNSVDHWFTIRKVHGIWLNLNSTNMIPGPQVVSDFYLDAFLVSIKNSGYTIFVVRGQDLPMPNRDENKDNLRSSQSYIGLDFLTMHYEENKNRPLNIDGADQSEMEAAIKASMDDFSNQQHQFPSNILQANEDYNDQILGLINQPSNDDEELARAIALSLQESNPGGTGD